MRIAVNASIVDRYLTGLGIYAVNVLRELARLADDLVVYTSAPEGLDVAPAKIRRITPRVQPARGGRGHLHRLLWTQFSLPLRLRADRATILFSPLPEGMLVPLVPQVVVVHDILPLHFPEEYPRQQHYFRYFVPMVLRRSRAVIAVSESTRKDIVKAYAIGAGKVCVVPNGYDRSRYRAGVDPDAGRRRYGGYLLYVGNLLPHKNLPALLDAFARVSGRVPHTLVVAGRKDPRYYPALEARARSLGIDGRVAFVDYLPPEELPAVYAGADALVLPSLYEGFGLPILEAMACGTPVVASRAASIPEVAGEAALLVEPREVPALATALERILTDRPLREAMRRRGLERAARFSWEATAAQIFEILREVAGEGRSPLPGSGGGGTEGVPGISDSP